MVFNSEMLIFRYYLSMQRIPYSPFSNNTINANGTRPVVLLQHGLEDASHTWVINNRNESLGVSNILMRKLVYVK